MYRFAVISFAALALAATLTSDALANGDYQDSCGSSTIRNLTTLEAKCKTRSGRARRTTIDLDRFIANDDGELVWRRGGAFSLSCSHTALVGPEIGRFGAVCKKRNGLTVFSFINLGVNIANIDGVLQYVGP